MLTFALRSPVNHVLSQRASDKAGTICGSRIRNLTSRQTRMTVIEVEKKFQVSPTTVARLKDLSPVSSEVSFEDCYFGEELAASDIWLRQRNGRWELKVPLPGNGTKRSVATVYREVAGAGVWAELGREDAKDVGLIPFAKLRTERTQLQTTLCEKTIKIVIDSCTAEDGFSHEVGELEILVEQEFEVEEAKQLLNNLFANLELEEEVGGGGKLLAYLKEKNETLLQKLKAKGVM